MAIGILHLERRAKWAQSSILLYISWGRLLSIISDNKASLAGWSWESLITQTSSGNEGCINPEKADETAGKSSTWKGDDEK
jgi:hypothetical protein